MPCSDPEPTRREERQTIVAQCLVYLGVCNAPGMPEETKKKLLKDARNEGYDDLNGGKELDIWTQNLCNLCQKMTKEEQDRLIYDGRNPGARKLADWWQEHQRLDAEREKQQQEKQR